MSVVERTVTLTDGEGSCDRCLDVGDRFLASILDCTFQSLRHSPELTTEAQGELTSQCSTERTSSPMRT